jgi:hypothetical protein
MADWEINMDEAKRIALDWVMSHASVPDADNDGIKMARAVLRLHEENERLTLSEANERAG